jgi:hypothetical protein
MRTMVAADEFDIFLSWPSLDEATYTESSMMGKLAAAAADTMSFDLISTVLSRCATPPLESLPSSPLVSAVSSPNQSRSPSPTLTSVYMDIDEIFDSSSASSAFASALSTPCGSCPASPFSGASSVPFPSSPLVAPTAMRRGKPAAILKQQRRTSADPKVKKVKSDHKPSKGSKVVALSIKRDSHNISERNRRNELKTSLTFLQHLVPKLARATRSHTGTILRETIAFIAVLQQQEQQLLAAKSALIAERRTFAM